MTKEKLRRNRGRTAQMYARLHSCLWYANCEPCDPPTLFVQTFSIATVATAICGKEETLYRTSIKHFNGFRLSHGVTNQTSPSTVVLCRHKTKSPPQQGYHADNTT